MVLQRWQQGYDLREVIRELGQLNRCVILELDRFCCITGRLISPINAQGTGNLDDALQRSDRGKRHSYFELQRQEAIGHVEDLERALAQIRELEQERGDLWREAAHDLRGIWESLPMLQLDLRGTDSTMTRERTSCVFWRAM